MVSYFTFCSVNMLLNNFKKWIMKKSYRLSVYLIKDDVNQFLDCLKQNYAEYVEYPIKQIVGSDGIIIVGRTRKKDAAWKSLLQDGTDARLEILENASNRALLFFKIQGRIFVIPFGYGKHMLNEELIERDFGLKTALNLMDIDKFLSIDKANLSDLTILTKTQSSRKSKPETFDLDIISDLLRGVTGALLNSADDLGYLITGNEGVYVSPKIDFVDIPDKLKKLKRAYESDRYKDNFDWIDNLKELRDPALISELSKMLVSDLKDKNSTKIHIAPPTVINWEDFEGYGFNAKKDILKNDFDIDDFYIYKGESLDELTWDKLKSQYLYIKYTSNDDRSPGMFWRYINYQTEYNDDLYVFTLGSWYQINTDYVAEILKYIKNVEESDLDYITCPLDASEGKYNSDLANSSDDYLLFDKNLVKSNLYSRSGIEFCDVFSISNKELVHVKPRSSSSTLSHLFSQGKVSSLALIRDDSFRKNLRSKLASLGADRNLIPLKRNRLSPNEFTVTFALIDKKNRNFIDALPFFSLINFRLTLETLSNLGYNVKVKNILRE